jgi:hypothetical protein
MLLARRFTINPVLVILSLVCARRNPLNPDARDHQDHQ